MGFDIDFKVREGKWEVWRSYCDCFVFVVTGGEERTKVWDCGREDNEVKSAEY